jgi:predicted RNA-binding protein with RPS1 domain
MLTWHNGVSLLLYSLTKQVGDELTATVTDVKDFGAIVEILRGRMGLLHMTEISHHASGRPVASLLKVT